MKTFVIFISVFLLVVNSKAQIIDWAFSIGSPEEDWTYTEDTDIDPWGNIYMTGRYDGTMDIDPGPEEYLLESDGHTHFIAKYNPDGELIFGFGLENVIFFRCINIDAEGNLYMTGEMGSECCTDFDFGPGDSIYGLYALTNPDYFAIYNSSMTLLRVVEFDYNINVIATTSDIYDNIILTGEIGGIDEVDIDPGPGIHLLTGPTQFLAKYDKNFNLKWVSTHNDPGNTIRITTDYAANIYLQNVYELYDTFDCDFGPGLSLVTDTDFLAKYDSLGNLLWLNTYYLFRSNDYEINSAGEIYTVAEIFGGGVPYDIDPGPDEYLVVSEATPKFYIAKYSNDDQLLWVKFFSSDIELHVLDIELDDSSNLYLTGDYAGLADFDPGPGIYPLINLSGDEQHYIAKYDSSGNILWASQSYGNSEGKNLKSFSIDEIICAGAFYDYMFYVGEDSILLNNVGHSDYFLIKYLQDGCSSDFFIVDSLKDMTCSSPGYASAHYDGVPPFLYAWNTVPPSDSSSVIITYPGVYTATIIDSTGCMVERLVPVNGPLYPDEFDLNESMMHTNYRPGYKATIQIDAYNDGCIPADGNVKLILDSLLIYEDATIAPDMIIGDTLIWNFESMAYDSTHVYSEITCNVSTEATFADTIKLVIISNPLLDDIDPTNNIKFSYATPIVPYDPNIKQVLPQGAEPGGRIRSNLTMNYSIQFQNTGTADADDIYILDTLDINLDISTFRVINSSHLYAVEFLSANVVKFKFDNINLPDSTSDEPNSHGFISYEIHQLSDLPEGTQIANSAAIIFDYNNPILTNSVINTIDYEAPMNIDLSVENKIRVYPNPASEFIQISNVEYNSVIQVFDMYGKELIRKKNQSYLDLSGINAGIYILIVSNDSHQLAVLKFVKL